MKFGSTFSYLMLLSCALVTVSKLEWDRVCYWFIKTPPQEHSVRRFISANWSTNAIKKPLTLLSTRRSLLVWSSDSWVSRGSFYAWASKRRKVNLSSMIKIKITSLALSAYVVLVLNVFKLGSREARTRSAVPLGTFITLDKVPLVTLIARKALAIFFLVWLIF